MHFPFLPWRVIWRCFGACSDKPSPHSLLSALSASSASTSCWWKPLPPLLLLLLFPLIHFSREGHLIEKPPRTASLLSVMVNHLAHPLPLYSLWNYLKNVSTFFIAGAPFQFYIGLSIIYSIHKLFHRENNLNS